MEKLIFRNINNSSAANAGIIRRLFFLLLGIGFLLGGCIKPVPQPSYQNIKHPGKFQTVAIHDLDNDGFKDIIAGGASPGTVVIWYGDGTGIMKDPIFLPIKADVRSIAVGDFVEDGLTDIAISVQREASGIMLWKNQPNRKWIKANGPVSINKYEGIRGADINKDGHMDLIAANFTSDHQGGIQVWFGNGSGEWSSDRGPTVTGIYMDVAAADLNDDGNLDLIGSGWGTYGALRVWLGNGAGGWTAVNQVHKGNFNKLSLGDVNGDGHLDVLVGMYRNGIRIFSGNGAGSFSKSFKPIDEGSFWQVLPVDLNNDDRLDIIAGSMDENGLAYFKNRGAGGWGRIEKPTIPNTGSYYDMVAVDLNRDGVVDVCTAGFGDGIKVHLGSDGGDEWSPGITPQRGMAAEEDYLSADAVPENDVFKTIDGIPQYKIGPSDILEITLWKGKGVESTKFHVTVRADGRISLGLVEDLFVSGLTALELDQLLTEKFKRFIKVPRIDVLILEYKSKIVSVLGPGAGRDNRGGGGRVWLEGRLTLSQLLSRSGGMHQNANLSRIRLQRKNGQSLTVDMFKVITLGEGGRDPVINDGDLVYVPLLSESENRIYIFGEVTNPGVLTFVGSEFKILDAVVKAGGVTKFSVSESTKIVRGDPKRPEVLSTDLERLLEEGDLTQNVALQNGDFVFVPRSFIGDINAFLAQIQPMLNLALTPQFILDIPTDTDESFEDARDSLRGRNEDEIE